jgi:hypothetical protein
MPRFEVVITDEVFPSIEIERQLFVEIGAELDGGEPAGRAPFPVSTMLTGVAALAFGIPGGILYCIMNLWPTMIA